jgi:hypothetical protein
VNQEKRISLRALASFSMEAGDRRTRKNVRRRVVPVDFLRRLGNVDETRT